MRLRHISIGLAAVWLGLTAGATLADVAVDKQPLGPEGDSLGWALSPVGSHAAVLAQKGSKEEVLLDGVAGPKIEGLIGDTAGGVDRAGIPVIFSKDGVHSAYMAKEGSEFAVFVDGKEISRGPLGPSAQSVLPLTFSRDGQHVFWGQFTSDGYHVVADGQPGPAMQGPSELIISPDGTHYAYIGNVHNGEKSWTVIDGHQVPYIGEGLQFTGRNALISTMGLQNATGLLINGKPEIKAMRISPMWISPDGAQIAMIIQPNQQTDQFLMVNGKMIDGTQGVQIDKVYFSPDGKRWAAPCHTKTGDSYMIVDGKKGEEYPTIPGYTVSNDYMNRLHYLRSDWNLTQDQAGFGTPGFTADSSKFVYLANSGGRQFVIIDGNESDGYDLGMQIYPGFSDTGNHIGYAALRGGNTHVVIDDKDTTLNGRHNINAIFFSPGGTRYGYLDQGTLYVDGQKQGWVNGAPCIFSNDDKHVAYCGLTPEANGRPCIYIDGKVIAKIAQVNWMTFSPDGQHVIWKQTTNLMSLNTRDSNMLFIDGKPTVHFMDANNGSPTKFEFGSDDSVTFIATTDGNIVKYKCTPSADMGVSALLAAADAAPAK
jgi:hypothetical protein